MQESIGQMHPLCIQNLGTKFWKAGGSVKPNQSLDPDGSSYSRTDIRPFLLTISNLSCDQPWFPHLVMCLVLPECPNDRDQLFTEVCASFHKCLFMCHQRHAISSRNCWPKGLNCMHSVSWPHSLSLPSFLPSVGFRQNYIPSICFFKVTLSWEPTARDLLICWKEWF